MEITCTDLTNTYFGTIIHKNQDTKIRGIMGNCNRLYKDRDMETPYPFSIQTYCCYVHAGVPLVCSILNLLDQISPVHNHSAISSLTDQF